MAPLRVLINQNKTHRTIDVSLGKEARDGYLALQVDIFSPLRASIDDPIT